MPGFDDANNPKYNEPCVNVVVPGTTDSNGLFTPEQCKRYEIPNELYNSTSFCEHDIPNKQNITCNRWVFDQYEKTIVEEWTITCPENQYLLALIGTSHFAGIVTGSALAGVLADK